MEWKVGEKQQQQEAVSFSQYVHPSHIRCDRMLKAVNRINWTHLCETSGHRCDNSNESDLVKIFTQLKAKQTCCQSKGRRIRRPLQPGWVQMLRKEKKRLGFLSLSSHHSPDCHLRCGKKFPLKRSQCTRFLPTACSKSLCRSQAESASWPPLSDSYMVFWHFMFS